MAVVYKRVGRKGTDESHECVTQVEIEAVHDNSSRGQRGVKM